MNNIESRILIVTVTGLVQSVGIGLPRNAEFILVLDGVAQEGLRMGRGYPVQPPGGEDGVLRGPSAEVLRTDARGKGEGGDGNEPRARLRITGSAKWAESQLVDIRGGQIGRKRKTSEDSLGPGSTDGQELWRRDEKGSGATAADQDGLRGGKKEKLGANDRAAYGAPELIAVKDGAWQGISVVVEGVGGERGITDVIIKGAVEIFRAAFGDDIGGERGVTAVLCGEVVGLDVEFRMESSGTSMAGADRIREGRSNGQHLGSRQGQHSLSALPGLPLETH